MIWRLVSWMLALAGTFVLVFAWNLWRRPRVTMLGVMWLASRLLYRIRVFNADRIPREGGVLIAPNHMTWADGVLLVTTIRRPVRFVVWAPLTKMFFLSWLGRVFDVIPVDATGAGAREAVRHVRAALERGEAVCLFPEGGLSRTGQQMPYQRGVILMLRGVAAPLVPVYLGGLWGSVFSFSQGRFFWKIPEVWPRPVRIRFGRPMENLRASWQIARAVRDLELIDMAEYPAPLTTPAIQFLRECRRAGSDEKVADTLGQKCTGRELLLRTLILRRLLLRDVLSDDEQRVGLLLPPSVGGVIANAALAIAGRTSVNLNYTASEGVINECIRQADVRHVLTSRKFIERVPLKVDAELVFLDDFKERVRTNDKVVAAMQTYLCPTSLLERQLGLHRIAIDDLMTLIFTSGSTGIPKGVMLSHGNIASNIQGVDQVVRLTDEDVVVGVLPFFHSFGFTATLWLSLCMKLKGVYHTNPLEARQIGKLCAEHRGSVLMAAPTFLRTYLRKVPPEQFATLDVVIAGAEKLPPELSDAFEEQFGVRPSEGYGATETSPVVSVNIPTSRAPSDGQATTREGSVGRPLPGVHAKVVDPETGDELPQGEMGLLLVKGPNIMQGYWKQPEKTAEVLHDGWYTTGDFAEIDEEGFIHIKGRLSRFSKIGGEMAPHIRIEEAIARAIGAGEDELLVAVTAVPDERKGERLVVIHKPITQTPDEVCAALAGEGLPKLWIPSPEAFIEVQEIPTLGTGKLALQSLREIAMERFGPKSAEAR